MAQAPHYNPQQGALPQQNVNMQHIMGQKPVNQRPGGIGMQQNPTNIQQGSQPERTIIDEFEANFQSCLAPLLPGPDTGGLTLSPEKLRTSVEHSIMQFTEQARKVEAYFVKKHAIVAQQQPEFILQEEIEDLKDEINRRDATIRNHMIKVRTWQENLRNLQNSLKAAAVSSQAPTTSDAPIPVPAASPQVVLSHPENMMQQLAPQRR